MDFKKPDQYKNINSSEYKIFQYKNDVGIKSFNLSTKGK